MELKCEICQKSFEWTRPASSHGGARTPKICSNPECKRTRAHKSYLKWKASHPGKVKEYWQKQALKKKRNKSFEYFCKDTPKVKKYRCQHCSKWTINRFNCPTCLNSLMEGCSSEYSEYIFMDGNLDDMEVRV